MVLSVVCTAQPNEPNDKQKLLSYDVSVSPNPSDGVVLIDVPNGSVVTIISVKGTYVGTWEVGEEELLIEGLPSGSYMARIRNGEIEKRKKFLIL